MKVTVNNVVNVKPAIDSVTIEFNNTEAGWLQAICYGMCKGRLDESFASKVFQELDQYQFISYDLNHPNWKETKRARENW